MFCQQTSRSISHAEVSRFVAHLQVMTLITLCLLALPNPALSQEQSAKVVTVPRLIRYSGVARDPDNKPLAGVVGVTFSLYAEQNGGAALWMETQNVQADAAGHYVVLLGSSKADGVPSELFASGQARWIGVQVEQQAEQPRTLLVSAPYALKAVDAETLGGLPASAFVQVSPSEIGNSSLAPVSGTGAASGTATAAEGVQQAQPQSTVTTSGGKANTMPMFTTATNIENSILTQTGTAAVNVGGTLNLPALGKATKNKGFNSQAEDFVASVFSSSSNSAVAQTFQWQAEPVNNNKASASGTLNLLYGSGSAKPSETGLSINSTGQLAFATGQKFPGTGTITGITTASGSGLSGGGTSGTLNLSLTTSCAAKQVLQWSGSAWACASAGTGTITGVTAGTDLTGGGTSGNVTLNLDTTKVPQLSTTNTFTGEQVISNFVFIGPFNSRANGQLAVSSSSAFAAALGTAGFTAASGSNQNGTDGIDSFGGSGDTASSFATGGAGIFGEGGTGFNGGTGVEGLGGGGGPCCIGSVDGAGGFFEGGSNSLNAGDGIDARAGSGLAGSFVGSVTVSNTLTAAVKNFKIDHPLDPANKYLVHASVESSEMMNIYTGNVTTDAAGQATVQLPSWFEALNTDFRYQLTVIGQFAQAIVAREIQNDEFAILTNVPNVKVSWQVTGVRQDAYAKAHPLVVEEEKDARMKGFYLHPELYGAPAEKQIEWARHPQLMKTTREHREQMKENTALLTTSARN